MAHQVDRQFGPVGRGPDIGEGDDLALLPHHGAVEPRHIGAIEPADAEAFFLMPLGLEPISGNLGQPVHFLVQHGGGDDLETGALTRRAPLGIAQRLGIRAVQRETGQIDMRFLAIFDDLQSQLDRQRQHVLADLVEQQAALRRIGLFAQPPEQIRPLASGADGIAHDDPAMPPDLVHQATGAAIRHQEALVADIGKIGVGAFGQRQRGLRRDGGIAGQGGNGRGRAQQAPQRYTDQQDGNGQAGAQETRGIGAGGKMPPEVVLIFDMLVGEEADPDAEAQNHCDRRHPARGEGVGDELGPTIEGRARPLQQRGDQQHRRRFLIIKPLEQREDCAGQQQDAGQPEGPVQPAIEAGRQDQQRRADQAAGHVGGFEEGQGHDTVEGRDPVRDGRERARYQQDGAAKEDERCRHDRRKAGRDGLQAAQGAAQRLPPAPAFLRNDDADCDQQRQDIIDQPIGEQRGDQLRPVHAGQGGKHHQFEHADAAGHMGQQYGDDGERIAQEEGRPGMEADAGNEDEQRSAGRGEIDHADADLAEYARGRRQRQGHAAKMQHPSLAAGKEDQADDGREGQAAR